MTEQDNEIFERQGFWWRTMGFTKCHLRGVFITEMFLGLVGVALVLASFLFASDMATRLLLSAISVLLLQVGVLLSSILSLLFYAGDESTFKRWRRGGTASPPIDAPNEDSADAPSS